MRAGKPRLACTTKVNPSSFEIVGRLHDGEKFRLCWKCIVLISHVLHCSVKYYTRMQ